MTTIAFGARILNEQAAAQGLRAPMNGLNAAMASRLNTLTAAMERQSIDYVVASSYENVSYVRGIQYPYLGGKIDRECFIILCRDVHTQPVLLTHESDARAQWEDWIHDRRYIRAGAYYADEGFPSTFDTSTEALAVTLGELGVRSHTVGVELRRVSAALFCELKQRFPKARFVDGAPVLEETRIIKTSSEVEAVRTASRAASVGLKAVLASLAVGVDEEALRRTFSVAAVEAGGDLSFPAHILIGAGPNSALPIYGLPAYVVRNAAKRYVVSEGDVVRLDVGVAFAGMVCDVARTVYVGAASREARRVIDALARAQQEIVKHAKPGAVSGELHRIAVNYMHDAGYAGFTCGQVGHGVGYELIEAPRLTAGSRIVLRENMVLALEMSYYVPRQFGCSIEDTLVIREHGAELLSDVAVPV